MTPEATTGRSSRWLVVMSVVALLTCWAAGRVWEAVVGPTPVDEVAGAVTAAVALAVAAGVAIRAGDPGALLDAGIAATAVTLGAWALVVPRLSAAPRDLIVHVATAGLVAAAATTVAATASRRAALTGPGPSRSGTPVLHSLLLAASWIAAPLLVVVLQAAHVALSPRPLVLGWVIMAVLAAVRLVDLSGRLANERAARDSADRFRVAFDQALVGMALVELDGPSRGRVSEVNAALCRIVGSPSGDLVGVRLADLVGSGDQRGDGTGGDARTSSELLDRLARERRVQLPGEVALPTRDGRTVWCAVSLSRVDGIEQRYAVLHVEMRDRLSARDHVIHLAVQDPLTGLANRRLLEDRLAAAAAREHGSTMVAAVLVDLDRFASVNQRHGAETADELLVETGTRLRAVTRPEDTVARLGGDRFAVLLDGLSDQADALTIADRVRSALARPYHLRRGEMTITAGIGVATNDPGSAPGHREGAGHDLLRDACVALERAKVAGDSRVVLFDRELQVEASRRATMAADLSAAITGTGLRVLYHPIVTLLGHSRSSPPVSGWQAQLVWDRTSQAGAPAAPLRSAEFMSLTETADLVAPIGQRVLEIALAALTLLPESGRRVVAPTMSVPLAVAQVIPAHAVARVLRAVETARRDPGQLCVQVSEAALAAGGDDMVRGLRRLHEAGVRVCLDEFGTGRTSLPHLRQLPLDMVQIDASLVASLDQGIRQAQVVAGLVQLASGLGLTVAAAGVASADTDHVLRRLGVVEAQGTYYGSSARAPWPDGEPGFAPLVAPRRPSRAGAAAVVR